MTMRNAGRTAAAWLLVVATLACAPGEQQTTAAPPARQNIIVEFAVPEGPKGTALAPTDPVKAIRKVADAILARLDAPARESAQLYENLPLIALEADGATLMQLLRMPEVVSVMSDRPVSPIAKPPGFGTMSVPQGDASR